jgi:hypothetical protein
MLYASIRLRIEKPQFEKGSHLVPSYAEGILRLTPSEVISMIF